MTNSKPSAAPDASLAKKRRYLNVEKMYQICLEAQEGKPPMGELLRRDGFFSTDLPETQRPITFNKRTMKTSIENLFCLFSLSALLVLASPPATAGVFLTNETAFVAAIQPGYYLENFNGFTFGSPLAGQTNYIAPGGQGFGWAASGSVVAGYLQGLYSVSNALSVSFGGGTETLTIAFTNSSVTAIGGIVANTDLNGNLSPGTVSIITSDGGSNSMVFATAAQGFFGYLSTVPVTSVTFSANDFVAVGHFYSGASSSLLPPLLKIAPIPVNVILTWPTNAAGLTFTLQSATNLFSPSGWTNVSPPAVVVNGQNTVTNPISGPRKFYRLRQ